MEERSVEMIGARRRTSGGPEHAAPRSYWSPRLDRLIDT